MAYAHRMLRALCVPISARRRDACRRASSFRTSKAAESAWSIDPAQSRYLMGELQQSMGQHCLGADVASPGEFIAGVSPVSLQMWQEVSKMPLQM